QVDKKLGKEKHTKTVTEKRLLCREYADKFVDTQREEFKRLGNFGDWDNPYITMSFDYEGRIVKEFLDIYKKGYVYAGKKPVHWCPTCVTALAEAEVEHADKTSPSVFVKFGLNEKDASDRLKLAGKKTSILIWTTTPWTLPANMALAVGDNIEYAAVLNAEQDEYIIVAKELVGRLKEQGMLPEDSTEYRIFPGSDMLGLETDHPFIERKSKVIAADFVSTEDGSGIVHIAPGHGEDDYKAGLKEGLEVLAPVNGRGLFVDSQVEGLDGQHVFKANEPIIEILKAKGALLGQEEIMHSYPHCWRCKKPVIFRATEQWFISMDHEGLREKSLKEVEKTRWIPEWGQERIHGMIEGRPDWCISRQRSWGVPIAVLKCTSCKELVKDDNVNGIIVKEFTDNGADVWYTKDAGAFVPEGFKCSCGSSEFEKETDILDVWFDSGVSFAATLVPERGFPRRGPNEPPADMYLEGSDQHRGWFQSSMLASVGTRGMAPYKTVLTHGYTVDGKGKKMSKSQGNVVAPQDVIKRTGADILRLWVSAEDYRGDVRISNEILARLTEAYRKIRNTAKYLLGNLHDFDGGDYSGDLLEIDRLAMSRLQHLIRNVNSAYESFTFHEVYHRLHHFCIVD
ncbi:MAG: isoleucine--tRNA ligase, partial [Thermodesulfovibrionales bacterium]|nr:isoleucine--tRNA ligase [Thermodesulfovibrionales bacterium]